MHTSKVECPKERYDGKLHCHVTHQEWLYIAVNYRLDRNHGFLQASSYLELVRYLGELRVTGEKGHKQLLATVMPRLMQFGMLPAQLLVPQLLQLLSTSDDRQAEYHCIWNLVAVSPENLSSPALLLIICRGYGTQILDTECTRVAMQALGKDHLLPVADALRSRVSRHTFTHTK